MKKKKVEKKLELKTAKLRKLQGNLSSADLKKVEGGLYKICGETLSSGINGNC